MKEFRVFFIVLLSIVLVCLISFVTGVSTFKKKIQNQVFQEVVKGVIRSNVVELNDEQRKIINDIANDKEADEIINTALDEYVKYINGDTDEISGETIDRLFDFVKKHKEDLEKITGEEINIDELNTVENREEVKRGLNDTFDSMNLRDNYVAVKVVTSYTRLTSSQYLGKIIVAICIIIVVIGLLGWSLYRWMLPIGVVFIVTGALSGIVYLVLNSIFKVVNTATAIGVQIDFSTLLVHSLLQLFGGIILVVIYNVLRIKLTKKDKDNNIGSKKIEVEVL